MGRKKPKLEVDIEDEFCEQIDKLGYKAYKLKLDSERGWPDRTVLGFTPIPLIEFKRPKDGEPSPHQIKKVNELRALGARPLITDNVDAAINWCRSRIIQKSRDYYACSICQQRVLLTHRYCSSCGSHLTFIQT